MVLVKSSGPVSFSAVVLRTFNVYSTQHWSKGPVGKWTRKLLAYRESNNVHLRVTRPPEICVNLVFKHIHAASSYTIHRQFCSIHS